MCSNVKITVLPGLNWSFGGKSSAVCFMYVCCVYVCCHKAHVLIRERESKAPSSGTWSCYNLFSILPSVRTWGTCAQRIFQAAGVGISTADNPVGSKSLGLAIWGSSYSVLNSMNSSLEYYFAFWCLIVTPVFKALWIWWSFRMLEQWGPLLQNVNCSHGVVRTVKWN